MSILQKPSAVEDSLHAAECAPPVSLPNAAQPAGDLAGAGQAIQAARHAEHARFVRLRRAIDRLIRDGDAAWAEASADDCAELKLELLLLREENARLKTDRHRPADLGTLVEYLRRIGSPPADPETADDAWSMHSDCLVLREALAQACIETEVAIAALQAQLREDPRPLADDPPLSVALVAPSSSDSVPGNPNGLVSAA